VTQERESEIRKRIDERFDQFSADELRSIDSKALTLGLGWVPPLTADERDFVRSYRQSKLASIRDS
jgi:hypothetical protein